MTASPHSDAGAVDAAACLQPAQTSGFSIDEAEVVYWGLCPTCSTRSSRTASMEETA